MFVDLKCYLQSTFQPQSGFSSHFKNWCYEQLFCRPWSQVYCRGQGQALSVTAAGHGHRTPEARAVSPPPRTELPPCAWDRPCRGHWHEAGQGYVYTRGEFLRGLGATVCVLHCSPEEARVLNPALSLKVRTFPCTTEQNPQRVTVATPLKTCPWSRLSQVNFLFY